MLIFSSCCCGEDEALDGEIFQSIVSGDISMDLDNDKVFRKKIKLCNSEQIFVPTTVDEINFHFTDSEKNKIDDDKFFIDITEEPNNATLDVKNKKITFTNKTNGHIGLGLCYGKNFYRYSFVKSISVDSLVSQD